MKNPDKRPGAHAFMFGNRSFLCSQTGAMLPLIAISLMALFGVVAVTIDMVRIYTVQNKIQQSADAALLGAVSTKSTTNVQTEFNNILAANFPSTYLGTSATTPVVTNPSTGVYEVTFTVTIPMQMVGQLGIPAYTYTVFSQVKSGFGASDGAQLELSIAMDMGNAIGSAANAGIIRRAADELVDSLYETSETFPNVRVSIVPFDLRVNIGAHSGAPDNWKRTPAPTTDPWVMFRVADNTAINDALPNASPDTHFEHAVGANGGLPPALTSTSVPAYPAINQISPFLSTKSSIRAAITAVANTAASGAKNATYLAANPNNSTRLGVGLQWAWYTLAQPWQTRWDVGQPSYPKNYNTGMKALVLITMANNDVSGATRITQICNAIKIPRVKVFVLGVTVPGGTYNDTLRDCASQPGYYENITIASENVDLINAARRIGDILKYPTLLLSE